MEIISAKEYFEQNKDATLEMYVNELRKEVFSVEQMIVTARSYHVRETVVEDLVKQDLFLRRLLRIANGTLNNRLSEEETIADADIEVRREMVEKEIENVSATINRAIYSYQNEEQSLIHESIAQEETLKSEANIPIFYKVKDASVFFEPMCSTHDLIKKIILSDDYEAMMHEYFDGVVDDFDDALVLVDNISEIYHALDDKSKLGELIDDFIAGPTFATAFTASNIGNDVDVVFRECQKMRKEKTQFYEHLPEETKAKLKADGSSCFNQLRDNYEKVLSGECLSTRKVLNRDSAHTILKQKEAAELKKGELESIIQDEDAINEYICSLIKKQQMDEENVTISSVRSEFTKEDENVTRLKSEIRDIDREIEKYERIVALMQDMDKHYNKYSDDKKTLVARYNYERALSGCGSPSLDELKSLAKREKERLRQLTIIQKHLPEINEAYEEMMSLGRVTIFNRYRYLEKKNRYYFLLRELDREMRNEDVLTVGVTEEDLSPIFEVSDGLAFSHYPVHSLQDISDEFFIELKDNSLIYNSMCDSTNNSLANHNKLLEKILHLKVAQDGTLRFDCSTDDICAAVVKQSEIESILSRLIAYREKALIDNYDESQKNYSEDFLALLVGLFEGKANEVHPYQEFERACFATYDKLQELIEKREKIQAELDYYKVGEFNYRDSGDAINILDGIEDAPIEQDTVNGAIKKLYSFR